MRKALNVLFTLYLLAGCSGEDQSGNNEHVWKTQTDSLEKAKAVEGILQQDAADKSRMIDEPEQ